MAEAVLPVASAVSPKTKASQVLLAACKATVYRAKNKQWEPMFESRAVRLQLVRSGQNTASTSFVLLIVDEQAVKIREKITLRYNTVFKVVNKNFFSLLDNGVTVWGFEVTSKPIDAQTFSVVLQNSLASLKESQGKTARPTFSLRPEVQGDQQCYLNNICLTLSDAINRGNEQFASDLARQLASLRACVNVKLDEPEKDKLSKLTENNKLSLKVQVEDKESAGCHFRLEIPPQTTIQQLKQMVQMKYGFPADIQNWIIGKRLPKASESLADCGIKRSGFTLYLFLASSKPKTPAITQIRATSEPSTPTPSPQINDAQRGVLRVHSDSDLQTNAPVNLVTQLATSFNQLAQNAMQSMPVLPMTMYKEGWNCPQCTYLNVPTRPGCELCSAARPDDYQVPEHFLPDGRELERIEREQTELLLLQEIEEREREERDRNLQQLLSVVDQPLVTNQEEFECAICFDEVAVGEGVVLRECLHNFCRECLIEHIRNSTEPEVQCPFDNGDFACHDVITLQEIQELLTEDDFQKLLERSLTTAESQAANSFHCRSANCHGWCIYDDEVNVFDCPVCGKKNCLTCKAIHHPVNCKEYQDDLNRNAANDDAARKTQEYLQQMLKTKDGMNCPRCGIILVKKDGCDWMKCTMCKTEICWAVRGPRWGPGGPGDTTGGCRCRMNNSKCHPECKNCH